MRSRLRDKVFVGGGWRTGRSGRTFDGRERGLMALQNRTRVKNVVIRVGRSSPGPDTEHHERMADTSAT